MLDNGLVKTVVFVGLLLFNFFCFFSLCAFTVTSLEGGGGVRRTTQGDTIQG